MTIEAQLQELIEINKSILTAIQSGAQMSAANFASATEAVATTTKTSKRRTKAEIEADEKAAAAAAIGTEVVAGDPAGTVYWHSEKNALVFAQLPGEAAPAAGTEFVQVSASVYSAAKAAYDKAVAAKNDQSAVTQQATASTEHSAQANQATASVETSASEVTWDKAVAALQSLAQNPAHGRDAVLKVIKQVDPSAANVPALQALNKNAEIVAAVDAILNPPASGTAADPLFG